MNKKYLIFSKNLQAGGAERQLVYTALLLSKYHDVTFMVYEKKGVFIDELETNGIRIVTAKRSGPWRSSRALRKYIRRNEIDTIISYLPECNLISELASIPFKNWRVITGARSANPAFVSNPRLRLYYYAHSLADIVISNSVTNRNDILKVNKFLRKERVQVIYNIIKPAEVNTDYTPFANNRINIVIAANYREVKNLSGVLKALKLLSDQQRTMLHISWYGLEIDSSLKEGESFIRANRLESVISLYPSTDKLIDIYCNADVVGLFSHFEGLPNSLCEALVIGKMVICTPISDMPILLKDSGNIVTQSDSIEDIYRGFVQLIEADRQTIIMTGDRNRSRFASMFAIESIQQQILSIA